MVKAPQVCRAFCIFMLQNVKDMTNVIEIWKDVKDYEGQYQISNFGRFRSLDRVDSHGQFRKGKTTYGYKDVYGYFRAFLSKNGVSKTKKMHQLVAIHFIPNPENKVTINHIDGDKSNNHVSNLEWLTFSENNLHAYATGLKNASGLNNGRAKLTEEQVIEIYKSTKLQRELAKDYGVAQTMISSIKRGANWKEVTQALR